VDTDPRGLKLPMKSELLNKFHSFEELDVLSGGLELFLDLESP
jgi:hypothetical protein